MMPRNPVARAEQVGLLAALKTNNEELHCDDQNVNHLGRYEQHVPDEDLRASVIYAGRDKEESELGTNPASSTTAAPPSRQDLANQAVLFLF